MAASFKRQVLPVVKMALPIGLGVYLVWYIYKQLNPTERDALYQAFVQANYFWVGLSFSMGLLSHYIRGYRWRYQLEAMGHDVPVAHNFMAVMSGYLVNMVLPRVGEVTRAVAVQRYYGVSFQKGFGSIMAERALDMIILFLICAVTLTLQYDALRVYADQLLGTLPGATAAAILIGALVVGGLLAWLALQWMRRMRHIKLVAWLVNFTDGLLEGLRSVLRMKKRGAYLLATLAIWALYIGMFRLCFYALDATAQVGMDAIFAGFVIGSMAIVLIPGGIGAFPVGIMEVLALYGVAKEMGFALGWILWFSQTSMIVLVGGICMLLMPVVHRQKNRLKT
jgi:uncharacterized protein (TIRG00374 family)